jgi:hypothetical protein
MPDEQDKFSYLRGALIAERSRRLHTFFKSHFCHLFVGDHCFAVERQSAMFKEGGGFALPLLAARVGKQATMVVNMYSKEGEAYPKMCHIFIPCPQNAIESVVKAA